MKLKDLKKLISKDEKLIIIEDGKPQMVLISFKEYEKIKQLKSKKTKKKEKKEVKEEEPQEEPQQPKEEYLSEANQEKQVEREKGDLKVEDLPF